MPRNHDTLVKKRSWRCIFTYDTGTKVQLLKWVIGHKINCNILFFFFDTIVRTMWHEVHNVVKKITAYLILMHVKSQYRAVLVKSNGCHD